jgi:hypothetical protein
MAYQKAVMYLTARKNIQTPTGIILRSAASAGTPFISAPDDRVRSLELLLHASRRCVQSQPPHEGARIARTSSPTEPCAWLVHGSAIH